MASETVVYTPESNQANNVLPWMLAGNGGLGNGFGGWGGGLIGFFLGLLFGNGGFGNGFGGFGGNGAGFLSNQINNDSTKEVLLSAINGTDADVRALSATINADFNDVRDTVCAIQSALQNVGSQVGMSGLQVQNAIQAGNSTLAAQLAQCCCENRLLTTQQGYESRIQILEQTNQLTGQSDRNTNSIISAINAQTVAMNEQFCAVRERELQNKIDTLAANNAALRNQIDNANQTAAVASMLSPIQAKLIEIENKQPNTVPVQYPNLVAVNNTPTNYGLGCGCYGGFGLSNGYWA